MASIDERVVQMRFENGQFEKNVQTSIKSINELKKGLDFEGAGQGLDEIDKSVKGMNFDPVVKAIEAVENKFSWLSRTIRRHIDEITVQAERMIKSLSTDQISAGWTKYSDKTAAVQTIMSATASQFEDTGEQMEYVNSQLEQLNWFTDETSYKFLDMVSNIGKFTSNNIALDTSVTAMQGIATWAAQAGANVNEAGRAMYNLSQAISVGSVKLIDWKSIENANMATSTFKQQVIEAAEAAGTLTKVSDNLWKTVAKGSEVSVSNFNEALSEGWFTSDVLLSVLDKYGMAATALSQISENVDRSTSQLIRDIQDYAAGTKTAEEISSLWGKSLEATQEALDGMSTEAMLFGLKAFQAGQETKTFAEAIDYVKEAVSTGWMNTFETIFGDYEEAKEFWSNISEVLYTMFVESGDARNEMLADWKAMGGRLEFIDTIYAVLGLVLDVMNNIKAAWADIFPPMTAERLFDITHNLHEMAISLLDNEETMKKLRSTARGLFAVLDIFKTFILGGLNKAIKLFNTIFGKSNVSVLDLTASLGDNLVKLRDWVKQETFLNDAIDTFIDYVGKAIDKVKEMWNAFKTSEFGSSLIEQFKGMGEALTSDFAALPEKIGPIATKILEKFKELFSKIPKISSISDVGSLIESFWELILDVAGDLTQLFPTVGKKFGDMVTSIVSNVSFLKGPFDTVTGLLNNIVTSIKDFISGITVGDVAMLGLAASVIQTIRLISKSITSIEKSIKSVTGVFNVTKSAIEALSSAFKKNLQAKMMKTYAEAILILAAAMFVLTRLNYDNIWKAIGVLVALGAGLIGFTLAMSKIKASDIGAEKFTVLATGVAVLAAALVMVSSIENVGSSLVTLATLIATLGGVAIVLQKWAPTLQTSAKTLLGFSASLLLMVSALKKLSKIKPEELGRGLMALIPIMLSVAAAMRIMNGSGMNVSGEKNLVKKTNVSAGSILALAVSIHLILAAFKSINKMEPETILGGLFTVGAIFLELAVVMKLIAKTSDKDYIKAGGTLLALTVSVNLMIPAIKGLAKIDASTMQTALINLGFIGLVFSAVIVATSVAGKYSARAGLMLIELAAAMAIMPVIVRILGAMDPEQMKRGVEAVTVMGLMFAVVVAASKEAQKSTASIVAMSVAIGILGYIVYQLAKIDAASAISAGGSIALALAGLAAALKVLNDGDMKLWQEIKNFAGLYAMVGVVALLAMIITSLGKIPNPAGALAGAAGIALILPSIALSMKLLNKVEPLDKTVLVHLGVFALIAGALGAVLAGISAIPGISTGKAIGITAATGLLLAELAGCYAALGLLDKAKASPGKTTVKKFAAFALVASGLAAVVAALGFATKNADMAKTLAATQILTLLTGELVLLFSGLMQLNSKIRLKADVVKQFGIFSLIVAGLAGVVAAITLLPNPEKAIYISGAIALLIPSIAASMIAVSKVQTAMDWSVIAQFAIFGGIVEALGAVLVLLTNIPGDPTQAIAIAAALDILIIPLAAICTSIAKIPGIGPDAIVKVASIGAAIDALVVIVGGLMGLIGWIAQDSKIAAALESAPHYCTLLGEAIGGLFGGLVGGFVGGAIEGVADVMPYIGTKLSEFGTNMQPFFDMVAGLDEDTLTKAELFTKVVAMLGTAELATSFATLAGGVMDAISSFLGFDTDKVESMRSLGEGVAAFAEGVGNVDAAQVLAAAQAANVLATLEESLPPIDGNLQDWLGSKDIGKFGERLEPLAEGLATFAEKTEGITEESVSGAANAAKLLVDLEDNVPAKGGVLQTFLGEVDIGQFGSRLALFGFYLKSYVLSTSGIKESDVAGSAAAAGMLVDLEGKIPPQDGLLQALIGSQSFDTFGPNLVTLGESLSAYVKETKDISEEDVKGSAAAVSALAEVEKNLDTTGGVGAIFFGDSSFGTFSKNLKDLGGALTSYSTSISGVDLGQMNAVTFALQHLIGLGDLIGDEGTWSADLKTALDDWITAVGADFASYETTIKSWGSDMVRYIVAGVTQGGKDQEVGIKLTMVAIGTKFQSGFNDFFQIKTNYSELFRQNGSYIIQGLLKGIDDNQHLITDKMILLANATNQAFQDTMQIASPSVVMKENGVWLVKGIAEGIDSDTSAEDAITKKAQNIASAFKTEIDKQAIYLKQAQLSYQLWEANEGRNASDEEKTERELQSMVDELGFMAKDVATYRAALEAAAKEFGESSQQYVEAENTMNEALLSMCQQRNEIEDKIKELKDAALESASETSAEDRANAFVEYSRLMADMSSVAEQLGYSQDQLEEFARQRSGYVDLNKTSNIPSFDLESIMAPAFDAQQIEIAIEEVAKAASTTAATAYKNVGTSAGAGMTQGLDEELEKGAGNTALNFLNGLAGGIDEGGEIVNKACNLLGQGHMLDALSGVLDEHSPSKEAYLRGNWFDQGLANGISENGTLVNNATVNVGNGALKAMNDKKPEFYNIGVYTMEGFAQGIRDTAPKPVEEAEKVANRVSNSLMAVLGIASPSKVARGIGGFVSLGLAKGILDNANAVSNASDELGNNTISMLEYTRDRIDDVLNADDDLDPVITPILDMDELKQQAKNIPGILSRQNGISTRLAEVSAQSIARQRAANAVVAQEDNGASEEQVTNYNFTQNNYSPKALSRKEIYRQTRNQFSQLKGATNR